MKLKIVVHQAEEGGYWAEVPAIAGCVSQGESFDELLRNIREAVEGCLSVDLLDIPVSDTDRVAEIDELER
ncbi:type II toxin-antitoxin system HicB family antitoxin [Candidatus Palauibacter sp.]|uniref:type II toxin-antitoxin system HicB family antitoxin n=1 Tax=Candidatus Palauibacter sp. TaxID=3101350 RepID=UPI003B01B5B1